MADTKISALTDGTTAQSGDLIPIARSGANYYITPGYLGTTLLGSTSLTGNIVTTSQPVLNLSQTWNAGAVTFTGLKFNATDTASAAASLLLDLQVGGTSKFIVDKNGYIGNTNGIYIGSSNSSAATNLTQYGLVQGSTSSITWRSGSTGTAQDLFLIRAAAATLQLGAADAAAPVAQTLQVQSVVSGSPANTAGANFTIKGSAGNGNGAGGSIIFQVAPAGTAGVQTQNAYTSYFGINPTKGGTAATGNKATLELVFDSYLGGATGWGAPYTGQLFSYVQGFPASRQTFNLFNVTAGTGFGWNSAADFTGSNDVMLYRDAANTLALRNGTNAQTFNVYNTYTDASNYERGVFKWSGNVLNIGTEAAGTGTQRGVVFGVNPTGTPSIWAAMVGSYIRFYCGVTETWNMSTTGHLLAAADNTYDIGASVSNRPRNVYVAGSVTAGQYIYAGLLLAVNTGSNQTQFRSNGGGILQISDPTAAAFDRLQFGGTSSSFPALKRSSATLQVRLADDSAYSNLAAAQLYSPPTALTSGATITWNANTSSVASLTLNDVGATLTMSNLVAGGTYLLIITQGVGGSKTITTWTNFKWANGTAPTLSTTAGAIDVISAYSDGTYLYASAQTGFA